MDSAKPTRLQSLDQTRVGHKLRIAGRMLSYDPVTGLVLLVDRDSAFLVDVSLCVDPWSSTWIRERLGVIMAIGHLESSTEELPIPVLPAYAPAPAVNPCMVLRAILVTHTPDLDLELWNAAIEEENDGRGEIVTPQEVPT